MDLKVSQKTLEYDSCLNFDGDSFDESTSTAKPINSLAPGKYGSDLYFWFLNSLYRVGRWALAGIATGHH